METLRALKFGLGQASRSWRMLAWLFVINFLFSLVLVLPIYSLIAGSVRGSLMAERLRDHLDGLWLVDLVNSEQLGRMLNSVSLLFLILPLVYLLLNTLLSGGILANFNRRERFCLSRFLGDCGAYLWRFLRLFLISLIFYGVIAAIAFALGAYIDSVSQRVARQTPLVYLEWGRLSLIFVLFLLVNMIFDYAKIGTITSDSHGMFRQTGNALRFVWGYFIKASGLYLTIGIIGLVVTAVFLLPYVRLNQTSWPLIVIGFVLGQAGVVARLWTRLLFYASQLEFYSAATHAGKEPCA